MTSQPLTPTITASTTNISQESLDCGLKALGWCKGEKCQRLARLRYFLPIFLLTVIIHGATETYFRISTKQMAYYHKNDSQLIDWLLVSSNIFQALLALIMAHWSQHYHPISWLGGSIIFQSVFCFLSVIPTLTQYDFDITSPKYDDFSSICKISFGNSSLMNLENDHQSEHYLTKITMLFLLQIGIALGYTALYTIGLPYVDNNANIEDVPTIYGTILATHFWGSLLGIVITFIADIQHLNWWFGWIIFGPLLLITGILITLFPRKLLNIILKQAAQRIIDGTSINPLISRPHKFQYLDTMNFLPALKRLLFNKILLLNLCGLTLIKTGILNYEMNRDNYLQSRFYFPTNENNGIMDEWTSRLLSYLLEPPIVGTVILITGLLISRLKPSARCLSIWNIISESLVIIIFISYVFIDCSKFNSLVGVRKGVVTQPYCSRECICLADEVLFMPVCPEKSNQTYFSPCHAGCKTKVSLNDVTIYENCTCSPNGARVTQGACNMKECQIKWTIFQILSVLATALYGTILICKILISVRSILDQDKPLALALELLLSGIFVYIPGKFIYDIIARNVCAFWSFNYKKCLLHDSLLYGDLLNFVTMIFLGIALILEIFVYIFVGDLDLFTRNPPYEETFSFPSSSLSPPPVTSINAPQQLTDNTNQTQSNEPDEHDNDVSESVPFLQLAVNGNQSNQQQQQEQQQQQKQEEEEEEEKPQLKFASFHRPAILRPTSPSSSSDSQFSSPQISSYHRQGAIPKTTVALQFRRFQTSETDF